MPFTQAQLTTFFTNAATGTTPSTSQQLALQALAAQNSSGSITDDAARQQAIALGANTTTAVGVDAYQFFTGTAPSQDGLKFLNAAYATGGSQATLNGENRFIAQSVSLALGNTAAKTSFSNLYGTLSVADATKAAYEIIIGTPAATAAGINVANAVAFLSSASSVTYFTNFVKANVPGLTAAADIDLAVKAAIVGEIFYAATTFNNNAGVGNYATATNKLLVDLADDGTLVANNAAGINLFTAYGNGGSTGGVVGSTIALTAGIDSLTGTANDDTFNGVVVIANATTDIKTTYSAADTITGGSGIDTLNLTVLDPTNAALGSKTIDTAAVTGMENINIRTLSSTAADVTTVAAGGFGGALQFISDRSSNAVTLTGLASGQALGLNGVSGAANVALIGTYGGTVTGATINLSNGVIDNAAAGTNTIVVNGAGLTSATINSTGAANSIATVAVGPGGTISTLNLNASANLSMTGFTGLGSATAGATGTIAVTGNGNVTFGAGGITAAGGNLATLNITTGAGTLNTGTINNAGFAANAVINVSGASTTTTANTASVTLGTLGANVKTLNAGGLTAGGVAVTLGSNAAANFTGGAGTDVVTIGAGQGAAYTGTIAAGAGSDIIAFTTGADLASNLTSLATGFEILRVSNTSGATQTFDPTLISGITSYQLNGQSGAGSNLVLNNLVANATITAIANMANSTTLNLNNAGGTADAVTLRLDNLATTGANTAGVSVAGLALGGNAVAGQIETLNIVSAGRNTGTGIYNAVTLAASGGAPFADANKVVVTGTNGLTLTTGVTGHSITIDASAGGPLNLTNTAAVTGTATIIGSASNDTISTANTANIYTGAGGDAITLGAGVQTLVYKVAADSTLDVTGTAGASGTGGTVNSGKMDTVTAFTSGADKIDITNLAFTGLQLGGVADKGTVANDAAVAAKFAETGTYSDGINTRGLSVVHTAGGDLFLAIDANKNGVFDAASDIVIKLVATAALASTDFIGN